MKKTHTIITISPFTSLTPSITNRSFITLLVLVPHILMLAVTKTYSSLLLIFTAIVVSVLIEALNALKRKDPAFNLEVVVQGVLIGMLIPSGYPIVPFAFIVIASLLLVKYFFGGFAYSWINPIAFTLIIAYLLGFHFFNVDLLVLDFINVKEPISYLVSQGTIDVFYVDTEITTFLNTYIFSYIGSEITPGYISYMWDSFSVIPAFRFGLLTLLASIVLFSLDVIRYYIPTAFIFSYSILVALFGQSVYYGAFAQGDIIFGLFSSGVLFTAFFVLDWPGTSPLNPLGKVLYGFISGAIAFVIVGNGQSAIGLMFTILLVNILSPLIQLFEEALAKRKLKARILNQKGTA